MTRTFFGTTLAASLALSACASESQPPQSTAGADAAVQTQPAPAALALQPFNPGENAIFKVASTLITGEKDAVLIDAQFSTLDAARLVELVRASGKRLTTIYISHGDPDFYFGLETLHTAFPEAKIVASPATIAHILETKDKKLAYWGPILGAGAPKTVIVPEPLQGDRIELEGRSLDVIGLDGPTPDRTYLWIPSIRTVVGGIPVMAGEHVWMADTQTPESHAHWLAQLDDIRARKPDRVIPGHYAPTAALDLAAVDFTAAYIRAYDEEAGKAKTSAALIDAMKRRYPDLGGQPSLELSAKVTTGEMRWP
jgi:glyoxylase-like metal-dependent hydrolase (beta-lactamase superfamily II)